MTAALTRSLADYRRGVQAQVAQLDALVRLAARQRDAARAGDLAALSSASEEREVVMGAVLAIEVDLRPLRESLGEHLEALRGRSEFESVRLLHREVESLIDRALAVDAETRVELERTERSRRRAAQDLDAGEATLAAYRKTLQPGPSRSAIVDRRG